MRVDGATEWGTALDSRVPADPAGARDRAIYNGLAIWNGSCCR